MVWTQLTSLLINMNINNEVYSDAEHVFNSEKNAQVFPFRR